MQRSKPQEDCENGLSSQLVQLLTQAQTVSFEQTGLILWIFHERLIRRRRQYENNKQVQDEEFVDYSTGSRVSQFVSSYGFEKPSLIQN